MEEDEEGNKEEARNRQSCEGRSEEPVGASGGERDERGKAVEEEAGQGRTRERI